MRRLRVVLLLLLALLATATAAAARGQQRPQQVHSQKAQQHRQHLHKLFGALDADADGELHRQELSTAIGALGGSSSSQPQAQQYMSLEQSVEAAVGRLDSQDAGLGVSEAELEEHLQKLCAVMGSVADWVAYGLGLPQYADAFRSNAITALDFPMLVNDGGVLLGAELQVHSQLHRQKLVRAMKRQILGLGTPPGPFAGHSLACSLVGAATQQRQMLRQPGGAPASAAAAVACSWQPPTDAGQPPLHAYVLERLDASHAAASWRRVALLPDSLTSRFTDVGLQPGEYTYRLTAWNVNGRAPWAVSTDVVVPAAAVQQGPAAAADAAECPAGSDGLVQQQEQSAECSSTHQASSVMLAAGAPAQGNSNAVWLVSLPREQLLLPNPTTPAAWGAQQQLIATMRAAGAATDVGGNDSSRHAAASEQQAAAGGRQASAGMAALLGTASQSSMGSWLRALLHSFVLLVLPVCVRLLPVHVLAHAARRLAQLLQLLPEGCRRRLLLLHEARMHPQQQQAQPASPPPLHSSAISAAQQAAPGGSSFGQRQAAANSNSNPGCEAADGSSGSITQPPASRGVQPALLTAPRRSPAAVPADAPAERVATAPPAAALGGNTPSAGSLRLLRAAAGLPRCRSEATLTQQQRAVSSSGRALAADAWLCAAEEQPQRSGAPLQLDEQQQQLAWRLSQQQLQEPTGRKRCGFPRVPAAV